MVNKENVLNAEIKACYHLFYIIDTSLIMTDKTQGGRH